MSPSNEDKDTKGRSWDQLTGGTTSAATMGAGSTGEVGAKADNKDTPPDATPPFAGRTDDLLSGGPNDEQTDKGFKQQP